MTEYRQEYDEHGEPRTPVDGFAVVGPAAPGRPGTVTTAAVILYISGALGLLFGCLASLLGEGSSIGYPLKLLGFAMMAGGVVNLLLGRAILRGRGWARVTAIVLALLAGLLAVVPPVLAGGAGVPQAFVAVALNAVIVGVLLSPSAREYFAAFE